MEVKTREIAIGGRKGEFLRSDSGSWKHNKRVKAPQGPTFIFLV